MSTCANPWTDRVVALQVVLTARCNLACTYCPLPRRAGGELEGNTPEKAVHALLERSPGVVRIGFTGGEPLLAWRSLRRIVAGIEASKPEVQWEITTNGLLLRERVVEFLDAHRFLLNLSFDGVPAAQALRRRGTFRSLDAWLDRTKRMHPALFDRLTIALTLAPAAIGHLAASVEYFFSKGARNLAINPVLGCAGWSPARIGELRQQFAGVVAFAARKQDKGCGEQPLALFRRGFWGIGASGRRLVCNAPRGSEIALGVNGEAYACTVATPTHLSRPGPALRPAVEALALGRPDSPGFPDRLASLRNRAVASGAFDRPELRYSSYRRCADCEYLPRCYACPLAAAHDPSWTDVRRVPDFVCAFNQVTLEARDAFWRVSGNRGA